MSKRIYTCRSGKQPSGPFMEGGVAGDGGPIFNNEPGWQWIGQDEPAGGCPNDNLEGATWDSSKGGWVGKGPNGSTIYVYPDGSMYRP